MGGGVMTCLMYESSRMTMHNIPWSSLHGTEGTEIYHLSTCSSKEPHRISVDQVWQRDGLQRVAVCHQKTTPQLLFFQLNSKIFFQVFLHILLLSDLLSAVPPYSYSHPEHIVRGQDHGTGSCRCDSSPRLMTR